MDKFEKFVKENREAFDNETPPLYMKSSVLGSIKIAPKTKKSKILIRRIAIAAVFAIIIFATGIVAANFYQKIKFKQEISRLIPDYLEAERYYTNKIYFAKAKLQTKPNGMEIVRDFDEITGMISELKDEMVMAPKYRKIELADKIINGYRLQVDMLDKIYKKEN